MLEGDGELRTPEGWRGLVAGEVVSFLPGEGGAHQVRCGGPTALRFLAVSTNGNPDIVLYPDSDKLGVFERRRLGAWEVDRRADVVDYWTGESAPAS